MGFDTNEVLGFFFFRTDYANEAYRALTTALCLSEAKDSERRWLSGEVDRASIQIQGVRNGLIEQVRVRLSTGLPQLAFYPATAQRESPIRSFDP